LNSPLTIAPLTFGRRSNSAFRMSKPLSPERRRWSHSTANGVKPSSTMAKASSAEAAQRTVMPQVLIRLSQAEVTKGSSSTTRQAPRSGA
jgi:hypothetical protein